MANHYNVQSLVYETNCTEISQSKWDHLMKGAKRANKKVLNQLIKKHLPELFENLALNFYNPYNYFRTQTHFIIVSSSIEYFIKFY